MLTGESLEKFNTISLDKLERKNLGVDFNFREVRPVFERIFQMLKYLIDQDISSLPEQQRNIIQSNLNSFLEYTDKVLQFDSKTQNIDQRNNIIQDIRNFENSFFQTLLPLSLYFQVSAKETEKIEKEAKKTVENIKIAEKNATQALRNTKKEAAKIIKDLQALSTKVVVGKYSTIFGNQASEHRKEAKKWFIASIVSIVMVLVLAIIFFLAIKVDKDLGAPKLVNNIVLKIVILSIGSVAIVQCIKNYNTQRHLDVVNTHRQNALNSFDAINDQAEDLPTKNALILQVAKAIYDPSKTGYLSKSDVNVSGINALDFIKSIMGK